MTSTLKKKKKALARVITSLTALPFLDNFGGCGTSTCFFDFRTFLEVHLLKVPWNGKGEERAWSYSKILHLKEICCQFQNAIVLSTIIHECGVKNPNLATLFVRISSGGKRQRLVRFAALEPSLTSCCGSANTDLSVPSFSFLLIHMLDMVKLLCFAW